MKNLNGKEFKWTPKHKPKASPSSLHLKTRDIIKEIWPTVLVCEEAPFKPDRKTLYFDFYIPIFKLAIEVDGGQHDAYSHFFHGSRANFAKQLKNDRHKEEFCEINNIFFVRLKTPYNKDRWMEQIINYAN